MTIAAGAASGIIKKVKMMTYIPPAWIILGIVILGFCVMVFRLGVKAGSLSETDLIIHYSAQYMDYEKAEGRVGSLTDCYALGGAGFFERLVVICEPATAAPYRFVIGHWGQLLSFERRTARFDPPKA